MGADRCTTCGAESRDDPRGQFCSNGFHGPNRAPLDALDEALASLRHDEGCSAGIDTKYRCRCGIETIRDAAHKEVARLRDENANNAASCAALLEDVSLLREELADARLMLRATLPGFPNTDIMKAAKWTVAGVPIESDADGLPILTPEARRALGGE